MKSVSFTYPFPLYVDGVLTPAPIAIDLEDYGRGWTISANGQLQAFVDRENHSFFIRNPGLRDRVLRQINAATLTG